MAEKSTDNEPDEGRTTAAASAAAAAKTRDETAVEQPESAKRVTDAAVMKAEDSTTATEAAIEEGKPAATIADSDKDQTTPDLRREFVGIMFALAVGEVGLQTAALVQAKHVVHYL